MLSKAAAGLITAMMAAHNATNPAGSIGASQTNPTVPVAAALSRPSVLRTMVGNASWYGPGFNGHRTASGEVFNMNRSTIASRGLPFGTSVRVTFLRTGRSAIAKVNDRGPFVRSRLIDCSAGLAGRIGLRRAGTGRVKVEVLDRHSRF